MPGIAYEEIGGRGWRYPCEREAVEHENQDHDRCGEFSVDRWSCSRKLGHKGQHIAAHGSNESRPEGEILARWGWVP